MEYLHKHKEDFINAVNLASEYFRVLPIIVEKDYYVTMILRELSKRLGFVVFKGGTSLSKCHKAIKRFSDSSTYRGKRLLRDYDFTRTDRTTRFCCV